MVPPHRSSYPIHNFTQPILLLLLLYPFHPTSTPVSSALVFNTPNTSIYAKPLSRLLTTINTTIQNSQVVFLTQKYNLYHRRVLQSHTGYDRYTMVRRRGKFLKSYRVPSSLGCGIAISSRYSGPHLVFWTFTNLQTMRP